MSNPGFKLKAKIPFSPPIYFLIFLISNILLSYFDLSLLVKLQIGLFGLILPMIFALICRLSDPTETSLFWKRDFLPSPPTWLWVFVILLGIFLRFYRLVSLSAWPMLDEGTFALGSMDLSQNNAWHFYYTIRQHPPLYNWVFGIFLKIIPLSLLSLWFFPALLSALTLIMAYWAGRSLFSKSFLFLAVVLISGGFWPLYIGRICTNNVLTLFWEFLTFWVLGLFLDSRTLLLARKGALVLGFCAGLGLFIYIGWALVAAAVLLAVVFSPQAKGKWVLSCFGFPLLALGLFFASFYWDAPHIQAYLVRLWYGTGPFSMEQVRTPLEYIGSLFWGSPPYCFGPVWGGILNPVLGSFFFLGIIVCFEKRRLPFMKWLGASLILFLIPGLLSRQLETFRIIHLLPLVAVVAVLGMGLFVVSVKKHRLKMLGFLLVLSLSLDIYHLYGPYHLIWGTPGPQWSYLKSEPLYRAYQKLETIQKNEGPGMVLSDLRPFVVDSTLTVAVNPFDVAHNPKIQFSQAKWAAVIVSEDYIPFLSAQFPNMDWYLIGKEHFWDQVESRLGIIPITDENQVLMKHWLVANQALWSVTKQLMNFPEGSSQQPVLDHLLRYEDLMKGDRFLESCFWEKVIFYYWTVEKDYGKAQGAVGQYLKLGYPSPRILKLKNGLAAGEPSENGV